MLVAILLPAAIAGIVYGVQGAFVPGPERLAALAIALFSAGAMPLPLVVAWQRLTRSRGTRRMSGIVHVMVWAGRTKGWNLP